MSLKNLSEDALEGQFKWCEDPYVNIYDPKINPDNFFLQDDIRSLEINNPVFDRLFFGKGGYTDTQKLNIIEYQLFGGSTSDPAVTVDYHIDFLKRIAAVDLTYLREIYKCFIDVYNIKFVYQVVKKIYNNPEISDLVKRIYIIASACTLSHRKYISIYRRYTRFVSKNIKEIDLILCKLYNYNFDTIFDVIIYDKSKGA